MGLRPLEPAHTVLLPAHALAAETKQ
jgi:hypothetical protein